MRTSKSRNYIQEILYHSGVSINGNNPWDIHIKNDRFYERVFRYGSLGLGESYMDGWWECEKLDDFFCRIMPSNPEERIKKNLGLLVYLLKSKLSDAGSKSRAFAVGERHYDIGNDLYRSMLDNRMVYSCAYWEGAANLDEAQEAKLELVCRKLGLQRGNRILDIGCGWGGFAKYAAEKYGIEVVGITVSKEQLKLGQELCRGLPVEIRLQDYRDIDEKFDHIVSIGMFEHVGYKNHRTFMEIAHKCLKEGGLFLLHTIGNNRSYISSDQWLNKYIFPNALIPSIKQIGAAIERLFVAEDWQNFGYYYDATLTAWFKNFSENWHKLRGFYDDKFYRMWKFYLLSSAGVFRSRSMQVWQIVLSKKGVAGGYQAIRTNLNDGSGPVI